MIATTAPAVHKLLWNALIWSLWELSIMRSTCLSASPRTNASHRHVGGFWLNGWGSVSMYSNASNQDWHTIRAVWSRGLHGSIAMWICYLLSRLTRIFCALELESPGSLEKPSPVTNPLSSCALSA